VRRLECFYNTIAVLIEKECGLLSRCFLLLNEEGFGTVLIIVGKLVVMDRVVRDIGRFGFSDLSRLKDEADKLLSIALQRISAYPQVAA
jgi:probable nitrogen fixation protein